MSSFSQALRRHFSGRTSFRLRCGRLGPMSSFISGPSEYRVRWNRPQSFQTWEATVKGLVTLREDIAEAQIDISCLQQPTRFRVADHLAGNVLAVAYKQDIAEAQIDISCL